MAETKLQSPIKARIEARVFRVKKKKPKLIPRRMWRWLARRRCPGTGKWVDLGELKRKD